MSNQEIVSGFTGRKLLGTVFKGNQMLLVFEDGGLLVEGDLKLSYANQGIVKSAVEGALEECSSARVREKAIKELLEKVK